MLLELQSRSPLSSQGLPMKRDLFAPPKPSSSSESRVYDTSPQTIMPSLVDRAAHIVSDYCQTVKPRGSDGLLPYSKYYEWQNIQEQALSQRSNPYDPPYRSSNSSFENAFSSSIGENSAQDPSWGYEYLHDSTSPYSPSTCPRSYLSETAISLKESLQPDALSPPFSFSMDHQQQPSRSCAYATTHDGSYYHPNHVPEAHDGPLRDELSQQYSSAPSFDSVHVKSEPFTPGAFGNITDFGAGNELPPIMEDDSDGDSSLNPEPYAQLIFRALKSAPEHRMVLKEIYEWFEINTDKAKSPSSKGWQNSIRHNLSMNGVSALGSSRSLAGIPNYKQAFKKVDQVSPMDEAKKGFIWVLEPTAVAEGVKSTTRYRKFHSNKRISKADHPAPQRQRSGAKGGKAARKATFQRQLLALERADKLKLATALRERDSTNAPIPTIEHDNEVASPQDLYHADTTPYYLHTPTSINTPGSSVEPSAQEPTHYRYEDIAGCAPHNSYDPLFYDAYDEFDKGHESRPHYQSNCDPGDNQANYSFSSAASPDGFALAQDT